MIDGESEFIQEYIKSTLKIKELQAKVYDEKVRLLLKNSYVSIFAVLFLSTLLFIGFYHSSTFAYLTLWYLSIVIISVGRIGLIIAHHYFPQFNRVHLNMFLAGTILSNACWGLLGSYLMPHDNQAAQMIIIFILAGLASGGVQTLQANTFACLSCIFMLILPLCIWLFSQSSIEYHILGIATASYLFFMSIIAIRGNLLLTKSLTLQFDNLMLVDDIFVSNSDLKLNYFLLKNHEQDITLINQINETLQLCQNSEEIYSVITKAARKLFVGMNGGLTITIDNHNQELVSFWGDVQIMQHIFPSTNCWAFRSGDQYGIKEFHQALICKHYTTFPGGSYLCIPLIVNNNIIGLLNFNFPEKMEMTNYLQQKITTFSNTIKLSLQKNKIQLELHEAEIHDKLTGLFNSHYLNEILPREIQLSRREKSNMCVSMLCLDNYKKFIEINGQEAGDEVIRYIAKHLRKTFRGSDIVCKIKEERFVLVLVNTEISKVMPRLNLIRETFKNATIYYKQNTMPKITISVAVVEVPKDSTSAQEIIQLAEKTLNEYCKLGIDRVVVAKPVQN